MSWSYSLVQGNQQKAFVLIFLFQRLAEKMLKITEFNHRILSLILPDFSTIMLFNLFCLKLYGLSFIQCILF